MKKNRVHIEEIVWIRKTRALPKTVSGQRRNDRLFVPVLFFVPGYDHPVIAGRYYSGGPRHRWESLQGYWYANKEVTFWAALPEGPTVRARVRAALQGKDTQK